MDQASTITMTASLTTDVNIQLAFELLPVVYLKNKDGSRFIHPKNTREKIPYFGLDGAIICVKYKGKIRGIRQNEGQMNNVVSIDLQTGNKNVNIKLARSRVQLTGANSDRMGENAFKVLCLHLNMIQQHINYIRSVSPDVRDRTIQWVLDNYDVEDYNLAVAQASIASTSTSEPDTSIDANLALFLLQFSETLSQEDFTTKINYLYKSIFEEGVNICSEDIDIMDCVISNSVYNYNIGREVSLIELTKHLDKKGFSVSFHNWNSTHLKLAIPIFDDDKSTPSESSGSSGKIRAHRFCLHRSGSCKQTSPTTYIEAVNARKMFMEGMADYVYVE